MVRGMISGLLVRIIYRRNCDRLEDARKTWKRDLMSTLNIWTAPETTYIPAMILNQRSVLAIINTRSYLSCNINKLKDTITIEGKVGK